MAKTTNQVVGTYGTLLLMTSITIVSSSVISSDTKMDDPFHLYPYRLLATSHFGRIPSSALPGSEVPIDSDVPRTHVLETVHYLRLLLLPNEFYNQSEKGITEQPVKADKDDALYTLPPGLLWEVQGTEEGEKQDGSGLEGKLPFTVDAHFNIVVQDPSKMAEIDDFEFWIVAVRHVKGDDYEAVSNPVAFVITIDHTEPEGEGAAIYVGIIVLVVCIFALLIPLTVRTKRRMREGKPLCVFGSSREEMEKNMHKESGSETDSEAPVQTISGREAQNVIRENLAVPLYEGRATNEEDHHHHHESIQHKMLRSASDFHFQPRWLDPHFKDVYEHPHYRAPAKPAPASQDVHPKGATARPSTSSGGADVLY